MFQTILQRVDFWLIYLTVVLCGASGAGVHSCHEVKTAFQLRQIGPLKWVPEAPGTDGELQICKHTGPSCCTRKMEESYQAAVRRETLQNIRSYSFELKYLIVGHASAFQDTFQSLLSFTLNLTTGLFDSAYEPLSQDARPLVADLFSDLSLFLGGDGNTSMERSVHRFYDNLFPLVYRRLVNPGLASAPPFSEHSECLRMTRQDVNPFGSHPRVLAEGLTRALSAGRALSQALVIGAEVLNATERAGLARECGRALVRMQYCPHCRGLTLIRPCGGLCLNVMRGCLVGLSELDGPWRRYVALLQELTGALAEGQDLELALQGIRNHVNDAILHAQLHGPRISAIVDKVCGPLTDTPSVTSIRSTLKVMTSVSTSPTSMVMTSSPAEVTRDHLSHTRRSFPLKPSKNNKPRSLKKISREFMGYIQRYRSFFSALPEMLCESEMVVDDFTCWSGEDVVESYVGRVVGNGLQAQKNNPEIKVRSIDPILVGARDRLEHFKWEMQGQMGWTTDWGGWVEKGSGTREEASGECDDEDGCQGSGDEDLTNERVDVASTHVPFGKSPAVREPPWHVPTAQPPPQVAVRAAGHTPTPHPAITITLILLSALALPWHPL
ncbi:glypican-5-like [Oncorhynchus tshawytscha]|uniref:Glypican-5-like n=1 Tax=Oncorhynchus tshawytscha TaxID=74940 RepID=A0A8C8G732_ONCTS|nr:glypican-5-like [Oncorhynchus tshawytscha]